MAKRKDISSFMPRIAWGFATIFTILTLLSLTLVNTIGFGVTAAMIGLICFFMICGHLQHHADEENAND